MTTMTSGPLIFITFSLNTTGFTSKNTIPAKGQAAGSVDQASGFSQDKNESNGKMQQPTSDVVSLKGWCLLFEP